MGDTTTNREYRKPQSTDDPVNLTSFWRDLADDVDADVQATIDQLMGIFVGNDVITFSATANHIETITYGITLPAAPTHISVTISSGSSTTISWVAHADTYTTTGFRLLVQGPSAAWSSVPINYAAFYPL